MKKVEGNNGGTINRYEKGESGNPKGRPRGIYSQAKHIGYKRAQVQEMIEKIGAMHMDEIKNLKSDKNVTAIELIVIKKVEDGIKKGKTDLLEYILPKKQSMETEQKITVQDVTIDEALLELKQNGMHIDHFYESSTDFLNKAKISDKSE